MPLKRLKILLMNGKNGKTSWGASKAKIIEYIFCFKFSVFIGFLVPTSQTASGAEAKRDRQTARQTDRQTVTD